MSVRDLCIGLLLGEGGQGCDIGELWQDFLFKKIPVPYNANYDGVINNVYTYEIGFYSPFFNDLPFTDYNSPIIKMFEKLRADNEFASNSVEFRRVELSKIQQRKVNGNWTYVERLGLTYAYMDSYGNPPILYSYMLIFKNGEPLYVSFQEPSTNDIAPAFTKSDYLLTEQIDENNRIVEEIAYTPLTKTLQNISVSLGEITEIVPMVDSTTGHFVSAFQVTSTVSATYTMENTNYRVDGSTLAEAELVMTGSNSTNYNRLLSGTFNIGKRYTRIISGLDYDSVYSEIELFERACADLYSTAPSFTPTILTP